MKTQTVKLNHFKIAPRKVRLIVDLIKGLPVNEAEAQLIVSKKRASGQIMKLLRSAVSSAKNVKEMDPDKLFIKEARVDEGPTLKRFMPRAMGRATPIHKKTSHVTLILAESQKLKGPRFKTERVLPKKDAEKEKKEISVPAKTKKDLEKPARLAGENVAGRPKMASEKDAGKTVKSPGFMKRVFRRKSI